jgi:hypothetical protein
MIAATNATLRAGARKFFGIPLICKATSVDRAMCYLGLIIFSGAFILAAQWGMTQFVREPKIVFLVGFELTALAVVAPNPHLSLLSKKPNRGASCGLTPNQNAC